MHWSKVWRIADNLQPGETYLFSAEDIREAAECEISSPFDSVRRIDIVQFTNKVAQEFQVEFIEFEISGNWKMRKPVELLSRAQTPNLRHT